MIASERWTTEFSMDYAVVVGSAVDYIEGNLQKCLVAAQVAAVVGYSRFHFDRLFLPLIGETPAQYIRKRRLTEAARELVTSDKRILDIALEYQFHSQEALTRWFKKLFGTSPGIYRARGRFTGGMRRVTLSPPEAVPSEQLVAEGF